MFLGIGSTVEQFAAAPPAREDLMVDHAITRGGEPARHAQGPGDRRRRLVRQDELACVGAGGRGRGVRRYNADMAVIGAAGLSARRGITELDDPRPT